LAGYKDTIERLLIPAYGNFNLADIMTGHLQSYVAERLKTVSAKTVCNEVMVIKEMFKHAYRWGYLKINPAEHVERPKTARTEIDIYGHLFNDANISRQQAELLDNSFKSVRKSRPIQQKRTHGSPQVLDFKW